MIFLLLFAFLGGIVTVLSPCILPILPIVLSSSIHANKKRPYGIVIGFILSFTFFTLFLSTIVKLTGISAEYLRYFSVFVIAFFGLTLVLPQAQKFIEIAFSKFQSNLSINNSNKSGFWGGILIGLSLGLLWTPCVGPILASVISLALTGEVNSTAIFITLAYSAGTALPMFAIIKGGQKLLLKTSLVKYSKNIQKFFGVIMILTAIAIYFGFDRQLQTLILEKFPNYGTGLTQLEENDLVNDALEKISENENTTETKYPLAPEITGANNWINSEPLKIKELKGKVILIDFWTYTCINCIRTLPYLRNWHAKYADDGLVIIGIHTPEFEFEKKLSNVQEAVSDFKIKYPVVQDNDYKTWSIYKNRYWPAKYLIDHAGYIRYTHFGEGQYDETESKIQELLAEAGASINEEISNASYNNYSQTPETYLGYERMRGFISPEIIKKNTFTQYSYPKNLGTNNFAFNGTWQINEQYSEAIAGSELKINFLAQNVYLVMRNDIESEVEVYLDGEFYKTIIVSKDMLFTLVELESAGTHILELKFKKSGTQIFAFTFG